jgi:hypothetical protein
MAKKEQPSKPIEVAPGKVVSDHKASLALSRGQLDIVIRYLREIAAPAIQHRDSQKGIIHETATISKIADMLEKRPNLDWHFKLSRPRSGSPSSRAGTLIENVQIGRNIHKFIISRAVTKDVDHGTELKNAIEDFCKIHNIGRTKAYQAYVEYKKYRGYNMRCEPMPIRERVSKRQKSTRKQLKK